MDDFKEWENNCSDGLTRANYFWNTKVLPLAKKKGKEIVGERKIALTHLKRTLVINYMINISKRGSTMTLHCEDNKGKRHYDQEWFQDGFFESTDEDELFDVVKDLMEKDTTKSIDNTEKVL